MQWANPEALQGKQIKVLFKNKLQGKKKGRGAYKINEI